MLISSLKRFTAALTLLLLIALAFNGRIGQQWNATAFARASHFSNAAADSPIVNDVGRRNQGMLGLALATRF